MDRFFNMDNKFFTFMSRVADLIILNLLCIVCCIPVVTIGMKSLISSADFLNPLNRI